MPFRLSPANRVSQIQPWPVSKTAHSTGDPPPMLSEGMADPWGPEREEAPDHPDADSYSYAPEQLSQPRPTQLHQLNAQRVTEPAAPSFRPASSSTSSSYDPGSGLLEPGIEDPSLLGPSYDPAAPLATSTEAKRSAMWMVFLPLAAAGAGAALARTQTTKPMWIAGAAALSGGAVILAAALAKE